MSYHGFGRDPYPTPIPRAPDPIEQPSGDIRTMTMIISNPMLEPARLETGDEALLKEMQARTGTTQPTSDPAAFEQPEVRAPVPMLTAPVVQPTRVVSPYVPVRAPAPVVSPYIAPTAVRTPVVSPYIAPTRIAPMPVIALPSGEASTRLPVEPIIERGAPVTAPMPVHPVVGTSRSTEPITTFVPTTGLDPAQPRVPIVPGPQCPPGYLQDPVYGECKPPIDNPVAPIIEFAPPPAGPIPPGPPPARPIPHLCPPGQQTVIGKGFEPHCVPLPDPLSKPTECPPGYIKHPTKGECLPVPTQPLTLPPPGNGTTGTIPPGNGTTGAISSGAENGTNYIVDPAVAAAAAANAAAIDQQKKSSVVPIAIAAGAALLLSRLL